MIKSLDVVKKINQSQYGYRLDTALSQLLPNNSRSQIKQWILQKKVTLNKSIITIPKKKVFGGELIEIFDIFKNVQFFESQDIPLRIVYEDDFILVVNKPSNFVVHPGAGNLSGTLLNALLYYYPMIASVPRAGIVQRLDKDTTGLMLIAKDILTRTKLIQLFRLNKIVREYDAIVIGNIFHDGMINQPISRHAINRTCMVVSRDGKSAVTHYRVLENYFGYTRIKLQLETGRTHQIRVHMAYIHHPIIGDQKYGNFRRVLKLKEKCQTLKNYLYSFNRQALHASVLKCFHPITGDKMVWRAPLPKDMADLLANLKFFMK